MSYEDRLRRLAIHVVDEVGEPSSVLDVEPEDLDPSTLALARLAALIAISGSVTSFGALVDEAVSAGASPGECVDVLVGIVNVVGLPRVVEAAPNLATALGYDIDDALRAPPVD